MAYRKYKLGDLIEQYDEINLNGEFADISDLQGINSNKYFQECKSNKNDIDLYRYRICRHGMFSYNRATSRNGEKISIALRTGGDCVVSPSYYCFRVKDEEVLCPEYLDIWFKRPVFDRYARFNSWGSATEFFSFDDFCATEIMLPSISEQRKIVHDYQVITDRISLLQKMNEKLENIVFIHFMKMFSGAYETDNLPPNWKAYKLGDICSVKGGKRLPADCELTDIKSEHPYIRVRDVGASRYVCLTDQFQFVDEETHEAISRYIVDTNDIIISIVGTIGLIGKIHKSLDGANLTENCVRLTQLKHVSSDYLYYTLQYKKHTKEIELLTVGAVQAKLPIYNIQSMKIIVPPESVLSEFQGRINAINGIVESNTIEMQKLDELAKSFFSVIQKGA